MLNDPRERQNRYEEEPEIAERLREELEGFFAPSKEGWHFYFISSSAFNTEVQLLLRTRTGKKWISLR